MYQLRYVLALHINGSFNGRLTIQYLLSQEEMDQLVPKVDLEQRDQALEWCMEHLKPGYCHETYCTECIISRMTDSDEDRSLNHKLSKLICKKTRHYGE